MMRAAALAAAAAALAQPSLAQRDFAANPIRISLIGDSITAGVCSTNGEDYSFFLQELLGPSYVVSVGWRPTYIPPFPLLQLNTPFSPLAPQVSNFGNSGKTMLKNGICGPPPAGDCAYWDTPSWPAAQASTPDIV
jgi:hypothetical protein